MRKAQSKGLPWLAAGGALLGMMAFPAVAEAHLNSTGLGPVYDGVLHFFASPEDVLPVLAMGLYAGQRGAPWGRRALWVTPLSWILGGWLGLGHAAMNGTVISCVSFVVLGGLLAADAKIGLSGLTALAALLGFSHGYLNGAGIGTTDSPGVALLGLAASVFVVVALTSALVIPLRVGWTRIVVRVAGSWIVASGILLVGWAMRRR